jgi:hypothetical protein
MTQILYSNEHNNGRLCLRLHSGNKVQTVIIWFTIAFRFAVDSTRMTLTPRFSTVDTAAIGSQSKLSSGDVQSLSKSYSCAGRVATHGGGYAKVRPINPYH